MTDTYVGLDVCHPGEIIPTALACAETAGASGRALLEAVIAGLALHMQIANRSRCIATACITPDRPRGWCRSLRRGSSATNPPSRRRR